MPGQKRQQALRVGDRARSKLNRRVGTVDAVDQVGDRLNSTDSTMTRPPQDQHLTTHRATMVLSYRRS